MSTSIENICSFYVNNNNLMETFTIKYTNNIKEFNSY